LVFGFSLSLIALRLDVPPRVEELFEPARWLTVAFRRLLPQSCLLCSVEID